MVRILSAFVILGAVIGLVFVGIYGVYVLVLVLGGLALWEFHGLSEGMGSRAPAWLLYPLGLFFAFSGTVLKEIDVTLVLALLLVGGLGAFLFVPGRRQGLSRWAMGLAGALYAGMPFNYYLLLYTSKPSGLTWTLFTILAVVASDAAALLIGSRIGRHPFFTNISPKRTVEGAVAGVVGSVIVMLIGVSAGGGPPHPPTPPPCRPLRVARHTGGEGGVVLGDARLAHPAHHIHPACHPAPAAW